MIEVKEFVSHDGKRYEPGDTIEKIEKKQAQRLVDLGVAFFIAKEEHEHDPDIKQEIEDSFEYADLKAVAEEAGLDFPGNISKAKLIELIISEDKVEEIFALSEEGQADEESEVGEE